eukprot:TRINITY_DN31473_c0_g1_i1.p1 TRINITY_DN31473_c0_g1~~TRINITY_DN31473_c0_g1_i1.p1  ORF type:complete len:410 (-),score=83.30 TRINITY_DN31473_c0_g1_i1:308-1537(-)
MGPRRKTGPDAAAPQLPDHYAALGVPKTADDRAIRAAYRRRVLQTHPDKDGGSADAFHAVTAAFEALSQPESRAAYDEQLQAGQKAQKKQRPATPSPKERALAELEAHMRAKPREERRSALAALPKAVADALLGWMSRPKEEGEAASGGASQSASSSLGRTRRKEGSTGINKAGSRSNLYQVTCYCLNMTITSRTVETLERAIVFNMAMLFIRRELTKLAERSDPLESLAAGRFREIVETACQAASSCGGEDATGADGVKLTPEELGLTFRPTVSALSEVGKNVYGTSFKDLGAAIKQRGELLSAKQEGWPALRAAWIKLRTKGSESETDATRAVDEAWLAHAPKRAEAERRRPKGAGGKGAQQHGDDEIVESAVEEPQQEKNRKYALAIEAVQRVLNSEQQQGKKQRT